MSKLMKVKIQFVQNLITFFSVTSCSSNLSLSVSPWNKLLIWVPNNIRSVSDPCRALLRNLNINYLLLPQCRAEHNQCHQQQANEEGANDVGPEHQSRTCTHKCEVHITIVFIKILPIKSYCDLDSFSPDRVWVILNTWCHALNCGLVHIHSQANTKSSEFALDSVLANRRLSTIRHC